MRLKIHLSSRSSRFLKDVDTVSFNRIRDRLKLLEEDPFPQDAKRVMRQKEKIFRVRVGHYRILYAVLLEKNAILVVTIDRRERVYRKE